MTGKWWAVAERDLRKFCRTPVLMLSSVGFPVFHLLIMGYSFKGELKNMPIAVINQDGGRYSRKVEQNLQAIVAGNQTFAITKETDEDKAERMLRNGLYRAVVIIPPGFSDDIERGASAPLGLVLDNADGITSAGILLAVQSSLTSMRLRAGLSEPDIPGVELQPVMVFRKIEYIQYLVPGVIIMAAFMGTMISGATNLVMDRFQGVHESYFLTPLSRLDIVMGMLTSGMITTTVATLIVAVASCAITGLWPPDWTSAILGMIVVVATALGMLGIDDVFEISHPTRPQRHVLQRDVLNELLGVRQRIVNVGGRKFDHLDLFEVVAPERAVDTALDVGELDHGLVGEHADEVAKPNEGPERHVQHDRREDEERGLSCGECPPLTIRPFESTGNLPEDEEDTPGHTQDAEARQMDVVVRGEHTRDVENLGPFVDG